MSAFLRMCGNRNRTIRTRWARWRGKRGNLAWLEFNLEHLICQCMRDQDSNESELSKEKPASRRIYKKELEEKRKLASKSRTHDAKNWNSLHAWLHREIVFFLFSFSSIFQRCPRGWLRSLDYDTATVAMKFNDTSKWLGLVKKLCCTLRWWCFI